MGGEIFVLNRKYGHSAYRPSLRVTRFITTITIILAIFRTDSLWAAPPTLSDKEELNRRAKQEAQDRQMREQGKDVFLQQEQPARPEEADLPDEAIAFPIHTIRLTGEHMDKFSWAQELLEQYTNRKIGMEGINLIVKRLTNAFIDRGYVTTRALVPEQDLSTGTLQLLLVPGVIREIRFQDPQTWGNWYSAFPTRPDEILNLRDLEQGLEQMKRVPSQDVDMKIVPGDKPGESDVVITVKRDKPWRFVLSLDDSGTRSTGKLQASQTLSMDNLLGINDLFNISFNNDAEREGARLGTRGNSIYYSLPYGNSTFSITNSHYRYHQTVENITQSFVSSGESDNLEFRLSQLLHRDQNSKTHLEFSVIKKKSKSFIEDAEIEGQRKDTTVAKLGISHRQFVGQMTADIQLALQKGVPWWGAQADPADQTPDTPTTRYTMWLLDIGLKMPVKLGKTEVHYSANLRAQYTEDLLYGLEYFSIGNRYTVRGFDGEQTLSAERGWYLQNELSIPLKKAGLEAYIGLDYGRVAGRGTAYLPGKILAGSVIGLRGGTPTVQHDVFVGWPLNKPDGFKTATPTFGFQTIYQL